MNIYIYIYIYIYQNNTRSKLSKDLESLKSLQGHHATVRERVDYLERATYYIYEIINL